ncbi:hypothetical protein N7516_006090 [Penicillium verrucosum]|uniref:uncharacterized protein n=1 Tax=Penicillium verrucosum TaxID=60171 RepID=UPI00254555C6|nr:uncharacterized protein N7516_006090 [Penicillium verrucosum]KAJ5931601.1 hypothetical protein N7516_006090 [Penicillium verrucosum]
MLQDQFHDANRFMRDQKRARRQFDTASLMFIRKQMDFLGHMDKEIELLKMTGSRKACSMTATFARESS